MTATPSEYMREIVVTDALREARAALDAARRDERERCACVAEDYEGAGIDGGMDAHLGDGYRTRRDIAAAIRALLDTPEGE